MREPNGYLLLLLQAHLPFIRHPEHEEFLQEKWFFDALTETYYPLLALFERLDRDTIPFSLTLSLSPPLCEMLVDPLLGERYEQRLESMEALLDRESERVSGTESEPVVSMYREQLMTIRKLQERWATPLAGFRHFQESGHLEIITCPGTHPILPFCSLKHTRRAHIRVAAKNYEKHFRRRPNGIWLAECAYEPGIETLMDEQRIAYFFLDTNGILLASPRPRCGVHAPVSCANGVVAFARDIQTSRRVWSADSGYMRDPVYRAFRHDIGLDAEYCYIRPFLQQDGIRRPVGLKYRQIGERPVETKGVYQPSVARQRAVEHATDFVSNLHICARKQAQQLERPPVIVTPFDAELFGHWWFEGLHFLETLFRSVAHDSADIAVTTPSEYIGRSLPIQVVEPAPSSWGENGALGTWLSERNRWIYRHLHKAEERMVELARLHPDAGGLLRRALNQAARELLLAQASDWAFIMNAGNAVEYAEKRTRDHIHNLNGIYLQIVEDRLENGWISELEARNTAFQEMDYRVFL